MTQVSAATGPLSLVCFPHAGGNAQVYRPWQAALGDSAVVVPANFPGRGERFREPLLEDVGAMADDAVSRLAPTLGRFAVLGHSMGALVGAEFVRRMAALGRHAECFFASARRAPDVERRYPPMGGLPDREFIDLVRRFGGMPEDVLASDELLELVVPILRADFLADERYRWTAAAPLSCPVVVLGGGMDEWVTDDELRSWQQHAAHDIVIERFPGGHFFLHEDPAALEAIRRHLAACGTPTPTTVGA